MQKYSEKLKPSFQYIWKLVLLLILVLSAAIGTFLYFFPRKILNISNSEWVLGDSPATLDLAQSSAGQNAFIGSPWHFPPANLTNLGSSIHNSLLFSDTTPWFAYAIKVWDTFFGLPSGALQFVGLQVLIAILLLWLSVGFFIYWETKSILLAVFSAILVGTLPHFIIHWWAPSVMFQFLIVVALWLYRIFPAHYRSHRKYYWSGLFFVTAMTHTYFVPMIGCIYLATVLRSMKKREERSKIYLLSVINGISLLFGQFLAGGFSVGIAGSATGTKDYGSWSADLFAFFNTRGLSKFIPGFASLPSMEGFGYVGAGVIAMVTAAGTLRYLDFRKNTKQRLLRKKPKKKIMTSKIETELNPWKNVVYCCLLLFCIAVGPALTIFGQHHWLTQNHEILQTASIFRSSARFIWPTLIVLPLWAIIYLHKKVRNSTSAILAVVLVFQFFEFAPAIQGQKLAITQILQEAPQLNPDISKAFGMAGEVIYSPGYPSPATAPWRNYLIEFVRRGGKVVNFAYANRFNGKDMVSSNESINLLIEQGKIRPGTILISQKNSGTIIHQDYNYLGKISDWDYFYIK